MCSVIGAEFAYTFHLYHKHQISAEAVLSAFHKLSEMLHSPFRGSIGEVRNTAVFESNALDFQICDLFALGYAEIET